jgi:ketosteroid isomerase-like protein
MSAQDDFLATTLARQVEAEEALHNGDPDPRLAMWSTKDPVTVLGAVRGATGWDEVSQLFRWLGAHFSDCTAYRFELVAAGVSGDLAYTAGYEHTSVSWDGAPIEPYTLRVTHAYRREDGEWRIVHRHADSLSVDQGPPVKESTA